MRSRSNSLPKGLASARRRIDKWRAGNGRRRQIPESFWIHAADLARVHGIHRVSVAMRLSHEKLKARVETCGAELAAAGPLTDIGAVPRFVEVSAPMPLAGGALIEITDGNGRCMTIRGAPDGDVANVVAAFCAG